MGKNTHNSYKLYHNIVLNQYGTSLTIKNETRSDYFQTKLSTKHTTLAQVQAMQANKGVSDALVHFFITNVQFIHFIFRWYVLSLLF